jgi:serine/threonine protein kinase
MTALAEPSTIITTAGCPREPATLAECRPGWRAPATRSVVQSRCGPPPDTEQLPHRRASMWSAPTAPGSYDGEGTLGPWPLQLTDPNRVDGYLLVSRLGVGGMADVFYAASPTGQPVVMKILHTRSGVPETCEREYRLMHAMDPDCTAPALGHGVSTAGPYLITTYLPGYRSGSTLVGRPTSPHQLWTLGSALARVLAAAHARGVVHCDVKPSNLLVCGHDVRLIDFGIARHVGERPDEGIVQCSRGFAAPEQLSGAAATPAVDVFAWGCLLAYLAGVHPFASQNEREWRQRVQVGEPDLTGVAPGLAEVIRWTLARESQDRPSAHELAAICRASI